MKIAPALFACLKKVIIGNARKYVISQGADKTAKIRLSRFRPK